MPVTVELQTATLDLNTRLHGFVRPSSAQHSPSSSSLQVVVNNPLNPVPKSARRLSYDDQRDLHALQPLPRLSGPISMPASENLTSCHSGGPKPIMQSPKKSSRRDSLPLTAQLQSSPIQAQTRSSKSSPITDQMVGVKRRLGMGRCTNGYSNKKFKPHL